MDSRQHGRQSFPPDHKPEKHHQEIISDILKISLQPYQLKDQLENILAYLTSLEGFHFRRQSVIFLVEQGSELLTMKAVMGFSEEERMTCGKVRFGLCHCGQTAKKGAIQFFSKPPALLNSVIPLHHFGHYCVPIVRDGTTIGVMTIYVTARHLPSYATTQLLEAIANILATVIENQRMDEQLIDLVNDLRISIINLREEKKFSESIIQGLNHGLLVTDLQGRVLKSNAVAESILDLFPPPLTAST
jgi:transcriptional regulator with GAF, ATPase, and Fis domain